MAIKAGCGGSFDGLTCRMVIETKRVFDGCSFADENTTLTLTTDVAIPQNATFVSARVVSSEFTDFVVTQGTDDCCNVRGEVVTRFAVTYSANGVLTTIPAEYREHRNVLLRLPSANSLVPYSIEVQTYFALLSGAIIGPNAVSVTGCILQLIKVTAPVDILIPTYGYCKYPPCTGCICQGIRGNVFPIFDDRELE